MKFTEKEREFLLSMEEARLATSHQNMPHVKPVSFIFADESFYVATDYDTRAYKNVKKNPHAAISVDIYKIGGHKAVISQCNVEILEQGEKFKNIYERFYEKFAWVRREPWKEKEAPFLRLEPITKSSWGL